MLPPDPSVHFIIIIIIIQRSCWTLCFTLVEVVQLTFFCYLIPLIYAGCERICFFFFFANVFILPEEDLVTVNK